MPDAHELMERAIRDPGRPYPTVLPRVDRFATGLTIPLPDPEADPDFAKVMAFRRVQQARAEFVGARIYTAARTLRIHWPTAWAVVFDRTEQEEDRSVPFPKFLRVEERDRTPLVTADSIAGLGGEAAKALGDGLEELFAAVSDIGPAGGNSTGRPWEIHKTSAFDYDSRPPYLTTVLLPPPATERGQHAVAAGPVSETSA